jgi:SAM-dependent methyltransferase
MEHFSATARGALGTGGARQAGHPRGLVGWLFGALMAHLNHEMNRFTLEQLDLHPHDQVLEIGFGPGRLIAALAEKAQEGAVLGADHSDTMVRQALARNREAVRLGRVALCRATVSRLPFKDARFDRVCAVNSFPFWPAPEADLREVRRVLKPGGLVALTLRKGAGASALGMGRLAEPSRVGDALRRLAAAGFREARVESRRLRYVTVSCVLARS